MFLASSELLVAGIVIVAVAPSALNQLLLSALIFSALSSFDLYSGRHCSL